MTLLETRRAEAHVWTSQYFPAVQKILFLVLNIAMVSHSFWGISSSCTAPLYLTLLLLLGMVVIPWILRGTSYDRDIFLKSPFLSCNGTSLNSKSKGYCDTRGCIGIRADTSVDQISVLILWPCSTSQGCNNYNSGFQRKLRDLQMAKSVKLIPVPKALKLLPDTGRNGEMETVRPLHPPMHKSLGVCAEALSTWCVSKQVIKIRNVMASPDWTAHTLRNQNNISAKLHSDAPLLKVWEADLTL